MPKKSCLLEYLISVADVIKQNDGKKVLTADYFMVAVLKTMEAMDHNQLPDEIDEEAKKELAVVCDLLKKYNIGGSGEIQDIAKALSSSEKASFMDSIIFDKIRKNAEEKAKAKGQDIIATPLYLELIIAEPTKAIREHILSRVPKESDKGEDSASESPAKSSDNDFSSSSVDLPDDDWFLDLPEETSDEVKGAQSRAQKDVPPKEQKLSDIVQTMRNVRSVLLKNVYGQDQAINTFISGYFQAQLMACSRKEIKKPQATFLFAGPPGVGKTFLAEKVAEALGLPYMRFDMSEYANEQSTFDFYGTDKSYKAPKPGNVTGFVADNPKCVLLFDEIEKAHINIIHLFLQLLDAGRLRDSYSNEEVSFSDAVIIITTNVGKNLYEDPSIVNLSAVPRKKILKALASDRNPMTNAPLFPAAICSRFASGNVVMFNHLEANNLYTIAKRELEKNIEGFEASSGIKISIDEKVPSAIMFSEGGKADARTVKGRANAFFHEELYELFRLLSSGRGADPVEKIKQIDITVPLSGLSGEISAMFESSAKPEVLIFASGDMASICEQKLNGQAVCHVAECVEAASEVLFNHDISVVLCDIECGIKDTDVTVLNAEDINSVGHDFLTCVLEKYSLPVYILQSKEDDISQEEFLSFAKIGVRDVLTVRARNNTFANQVVAKCKVAYQQNHMMKLARENKALSYKTAQTISKNKKTATINLFDFRLSLITDVDDSKSILDSVSRPDLHFEDVIGAEDAKQELKYFVEYLKNPVKYMRKGVRAPKGVLLYGPPGTGKTLLAKAMAGESGVTFLKAEGNEFLKRYVGEGAEAVHALFNAARKYAPSIVFVDEIDAIGKDRNLLGSEDHTSDVLTAFLTEMDGFNTDTSKPVFVLAATNYGVDSEKGKSLDAALLRRFDRRIYIDLPNKDERKRYLEMKLSKHSSVKLSEEQLDNIAMRSTGMSLAQLESIFEMALRSAIRSENGCVSDAEFEEAFETFNSGEKKEWNPDTLKRTARHEAGHALICWLGGEKPSYITVVARGDHGGYMQHANSEGKCLYTRSELLGRIRTSLGGRACEIVYYGEEGGMSTGASGDLYSATKTAEQMICNYGMDQSVGMAYIDPKAANSAVNQVVRDRVNAMLEQELETAIKLIKTNKRAIDAMVDALMEKNHLKENEIDDIFGRTVVSTELS
ncbi:MAG: AAA family ATPase [Ruminococcaceae bacterium]|nr:AAA family ATPase [Oscillospiraceae bacterium]